jgi:hypothetical protein
MTSCNGGNKGGGTKNLANDAKHINTGSTDWYNSILFDSTTYKYYISGRHKEPWGLTLISLALISINPNLTLNYSKYYEVQDSYDNTLSFVGLTNLWYKDNRTFYVGGWITLDGIIGEVTKNTGQITLKKIFQDTGALGCISDKTNIYVVSDNGHVLKLDNNYNIVSSKKVSSSQFSTISISNNYLITYDPGYNGVVVIDKSLNNAVRFDNYRMINHAALVDNNNKLYYIDRNLGSSNLVLAKVDITNLDSPSQDIVKEYNWDSIAFSAQMGFSLDGNIILGITTNESPNNIVLLKINKDDFSIMNQVKLSAQGGRSSELWGNLNIMSLPDGGFVISRSIINLSKSIFGYILKSPSDLNIGNNCVFNVTNPNITALASTTYTISTTNLILNNITIREIPITDYTLVEKNIITFVGCLNSAPNILNNRNGGNNQELDSLTGSSRRR